MADRVEFGLRIVAALLLAATCTACAGISDPVGFANVTQDKFDYSTCPDILSNRSQFQGRVNELQGLLAKAEESPGGTLVGYAAYRGELVNSRAQLAAAERAAQLKNCDAPKLKR